MFHEILTNIIFAFLIVIYDLLLYLYNFVVIQENIEITDILLLCVSVYLKDNQMYFKTVYTNIKHWLNSDLANGFEWM